MSPEATTDPPAPEDRFAAKLRGFGPVGVLATVVIVLMGPIVEPLGALLALLWARRSRTPWSELGFVRPKSWLGTVTLGVVCGFALKLLMKVLVMPLLGAPAINPTYHYLAGNAAALPGMFFDVLVGAGFGEEVVFRGFLFERLGKLFGSGWRARIAILLLTSAWFGLIHYPGQGLYGALQAMMTGLVFGTFYAATGSLWLPIVTHAVFDVTAVLIIFWNLETYFAHLVFK